MKRSLHAGIKQSGGFGLNLFSDDELHEIHLATLEVLQHTGVLVESEEALEIFRGAGAKVDRSGKSGIVRLSPNIIENCIRSAPSRVTYHGRESKHNFVAEPGKVGFSTFGECIQVIDTSL